MAIRSIAQAIQSGETSLGLAVGVESMSLKYVPVLMPFPLANLELAPVLHRKFRQLLTRQLMPMIAFRRVTFDCPNLCYPNRPVAHGMDVRNGCRNVQGVEAETRRVRPYFTYKGRQGTSTKSALSKILTRSSPYPVVSLQTRSSPWRSGGKLYLLTTPFGLGSALNHCLP